MAEIEEGVFSTISLMKTHYFFDEDGLLLGPLRHDEGALDVDGVEVEVREEGGAEVICERVVLLYDVVGDGGDVGVLVEAEQGFARRRRWLRSKVSNDCAEDEA